LLKNRSLQPNQKQKGRLNQGETEHVFGITISHSPGLAKNSGVAMSVVTTKPSLTAADILDANKGIRPGFDALRILLSVWVFTVHAIFICIGAAEEVRCRSVPPACHQPRTADVLYSQWLSCHRKCHSQEGNYNISLFRVFRIAPALIVEVTLSALVLGPWLTEKSLSEYFSDPLFLNYFLNIVGSVHFYLPGVFVQNPVPGVVNQNLWTLKPEFFCYIFMSDPRAQLSRRLSVMQFLLFWENSPERFLSETHPPGFPLAQDHPR
jgi:hypothetical protein